MRIARALFALAPVVAVVFAACSSGSGEAARTGTELDCAWVAADPPENCWKQFVAEVTACLVANADAGVVDTGFADANDDASVDASETGAGARDASAVPTGLLSGDRLSCRYANGRSVSSERPLDAPFLTEVPASGEPTGRSFEVRVGERSCLRFVQVLATDTTPGTVTLTTGASTLRWTFESSTKNPQALSLTCPDGRTFRGDDVGLIRCLDPRSGGVPGYAWSNTNRSAYFALLGMQEPIYACADRTFESFGLPTPPRLGAGVVPDAAVD